VGFGWDVTGVFVVPNYGRFMYPTIESSIKWFELAWYSANRLDLFGEIHSYYVLGRT
jgi:hypothetical protein